VVQHSNKYKPLSSANLDLLIQFLPSPQSTANKSEINTNKTVFVVSGSLLLTYHYILIFLDTKSNIIRHTLEKLFHSFCYCH